MIGAIIGDIAGSCYEFTGNKNPAVELFPPGADFTDDSILLVATADALLSDFNFKRCYRTYGSWFPDPMGGYGARFGSWLGDLDPTPYGSWGNGAAMRAPPIGWLNKPLPEILEVARSSAAVTHNHPEGIKGSSAVAAAVWLARRGENKDSIRSYLEAEFGYNLRRSCADIRPTYQFNESCQGTVPEAIIAFLDSNYFEHAIRQAISLGGDADTLATITGSIAEVFYREIPEEMVKAARSRLDPRLLKVIDRFAAACAR